MPQHDFKFQLSCTFAAVICGRLADPVNGSVIVDDDDMEYGSTAYYLCDTGFYVQGNSSRTCQANGRWSDYQPSCEGRYCNEIL